MHESKSESKPAFKRESKVGAVETSRADAGFQTFPRFLPLHSLATSHLVHTFGGIKVKKIVAASLGGGD